MLFTLSNHRQGDFSAFLSLRQFNSNAGLVQLLEEVLGQWKSETEMSLESLGTACGMAESTVEKSLSHLLALLNDFMLVHACLADKDRIHMRPFEAWMAEGLAEDLLEREFRRRQRKLHRLPVSDAGLHEELLLEHSMAKLEVQKPRKKQAALFDRHLSLLGKYHLVAHLKYACAAVNASWIFGKTDRKKYLEGMPTEEEAALSMLAQAYRRLLNLLSQTIPNPTELKNCLLFLAAHADGFDREDRADLYGYLLNCGVRGMATGAPEFGELVHEIYEALIAKGLLLTDGMMSGTHFKNIVTVKVRTGRLGPAREFVKDFKRQLSLGERDVVAPYCLGLIEFHAGNLRAAIREFSALIQASPDDVFWGLEARSMLWKAYYEAYESLSPSEHSEMHRMYHSFRHFVARSEQLSSYHRTGYKNFIRVFNRLVNLTEEVDRKGELDKLATLLEETESLDLMANKRWILNAIRKRMEN